ncbi:MAG: rRNA maturation RNase YbeY [Rhodothalassiaceae bacterium]
MAIPESDSPGTDAPVIDIAISSAAWRRAAVAAIVERAARAALADNRWVARGIRFERAHLGVALATDRRLAALNARFRGRAGPTNVLSFPGHEPAAMETAFSACRLQPLWLGDIALADGVTMREAEAAGRPLAHHVAHLVVHGTLHCLGYDHKADTEAEEMERLEARILARLAIPDPYRGGERESVAR